MSDTIIVVNQYFKDQKLLAEFFLCFTIVY
jgi:hypothetical protein